MRSSPQNHSQNNAQSREDNNQVFKIVTVPFSFIFFLIFFQVFLSVRCDRIEFCMFRGIFPKNGYSFKCREPQIAVASFQDRRLDTAGRLRSAYSVSHTVKIAKNRFIFSSCSIEHKFLRQGKKPFCTRKPEISAVIGNYSQNRVAAEPFARIDAGDLPVFVDQNKTAVHRSDQNSVVKRMERNRHITCKFPVYFVKFIIFIKFPDPFRSGEPDVSGIVFGYR